MAIFGDRGNLLKTSANAPQSIFYLRCAGLIISPTVLVKIYETVTPASSGQVGKLLFSHVFFRSRITSSWFADSQSFEASILS